MKINDLLQEVTVARRMADFFRRPLYHVTSLENAANILKSNELMGSLSAWEPLGTYNKSASPFYISFATKRDANFGLQYMHDQEVTVLFEFSGFNGYEKKRVDYWEEIDKEYGDHQGKYYYRTRTEDEIRMYLQDRSVSNIKKYIKRIDVAFYGKTKYPENSRKLLRIIEKSHKNVRYHKTMSGLLTASKGVSFDEIMEFVGDATSQKPVATQLHITEIEKKKFNEILDKKRRGLSVNISEKNWYDLHKKFSKSTELEIRNMFTEFHDMFSKYRMDSDLGGYNSMYSYVRNKNNTTKA